MIAMKDEYSYEAATPTKKVKIFMTALLFIQKLSCIL